MGRGFEVGSLVVKYGISYRRDRQAQDSPVKVEGQLIVAAAIASHHPSILFNSPSEEKGSDPSTNIMAMYNKGIDMRIPTQGR